LEAAIQSDEMEPTIVYVERDLPVSVDAAVQFVPPVRNVRELGVQSELPTTIRSDKDTQTLISIPHLEPYQFNGASLNSGVIRPKTPSLRLREMGAIASTSRAIESPPSTATPKTFRTASSVMDWDPPKSPLKEITNAQPPLSTSPSRASLSHGIDSPSTFSSRTGSVRRYRTILEHPTLQTTPRGSMTRSRISQPNSPSKPDRRHQTISSVHSRGNMSIASRQNTVASRRTSFSSFESEVDNRFGLIRERPDEIGEGQYATSTDPNAIQAITQAMIGDYLYKYTRDQLKRSKISEKRHRRFFWVHPYTKTLYWSSDNPATSKESSRNTRSAPIKKIAVVTDENPFPPGLFHKSILCFTQSRTIKFTAETKTSHETWLTVLPHVASLTRRLLIISLTEVQSWKRPPTAKCVLRQGLPNSLLICVSLAPWQVNALPHTWHRCQH